MRGRRLKTSGHRQLRSSFEYRNAAPLEAPENLTLRPSEEKNVICCSFNVELLTNRTAAVNGETSFAPQYAKRSRAERAKELKLNQNSDLYQL